VASLRFSSKYLHLGPICNFEALTGSRGLAEPAFKIGENVSPTKLFAVKVFGQEKTYRTGVLFKKNYLPTHSKQIIRTFSHYYFVRDPTTVFVSKLKLKWNKYF
jgi:hypothetical protein